MGRVTDMGHVRILGGTFAGVAAAARLARVGHTVSLVVDDQGWTEDLRAQLGEGTLEFPAPWRDLLKKSGRPAVGALGLRGLVLVPDPDGPPTDRGEQWYRDRERHGAVVADRWRTFVDAADDVWQTLRPLGLEEELTPAALERAGLDRRRSLADEARTLGHPALAARVTGIAHDRGLDPAATPAWLASRLSVVRTFGRWSLQEAAGTPRPASDLVDVLTDRLAERDVRIVAELPEADVTIDTRDPHITWHRPRRLHRADTFVDQFLARPGVRTADPAVFSASASSPGGAEPWAQILTGALATYAAHERLTGEDIRPGNRTVT